jgi:VCBS repeat-containing protein
VTDDALGSATLSLSGDDALSFFIDNGNELWFVGNANFETKPVYNVTVEADDTSVGTTPDASQSFTLNITDENEPPSDIVFSNVVTSTPENGGAMKVADFAVADDALGTTTVSLFGTFAPLFSIVNGVSGYELWFNGNGDYEATLSHSYGVTVRADDPTITGNPDYSELFTLAITDVNDPVDAANDTAAVNEDAISANLAGALLANDTDQDTSDVIRIISATNGLKGTVTFNDGGTPAIPGDDTLTYTADDAVLDALAVGETTTDTFSYTVSDGNGSTDTATVTVTISGVNDAVNAADDTASVAEDATTANLAAALLTNDTDPDTSNVIRIISATNGAKGTVTFNDGGTPSIPGDDTLTYTADDAVLDALAVGETTTDTFSYTVSDGNGSTDTATVTVTITGVNDAALLSADTADLIETDLVDDISTTGQLTIDDIDGPETFQTQTDTDGLYGKFSIDAAGNWIYTADDAHDEFENGVVYTDAFAVASTDGTPTTVTINITGTNDAALLSAGSASLEEGDPGAFGTLTVSDVDSAQTFQVQSGVTTAYGTFSIEADGDWTYTLGSNDGFVDGQLYTDSIVVLSADGTPTTVDIEITGVNDAALLGSANRPLLETDIPIFDSGTLTISDVDSDPHFIAQVGTGGLYGTFTIDADGDWTYTAFSAHDDFVENESHVDIFNVVSVDGTQTTVTIDIVGSNDAPVAFDDNTVVTDEETPVVGAMVPTATDVDGSIAHYELDTDVASGALTFNTDGTYDFDPTGAFDDLQVGEEEDVTFTYIAVDNDGGTSASKTVTITVQGVNDAPAAVDDAYTVEADLAILSVSDPGEGVLFNDTDVENDSLAAVLQDLPLYGTVILNSDGTFTYFLTDTGAPSDSFTYYVFDGTENSPTLATVNLTINPPSNQAPVLDLDLADGNFVTDGVSPAGFNADFTSGDSPLLVTGDAVVADDHDMLTTLTVYLRAAGDVPLNVDELLSLPTLLADELIDDDFEIDFNTSNPAEYILTITAPVGTPQTAARFEQIIEGISYSNPNNDASFVAADRLISFTLVDDQTADTSTQTEQPLTTITMTADLAGTGGADNIVGGSNADVLSGNDGDDTINGGGGDDQLSGGIGEDSLNGDGGADTITGGTGDDSIDGGEGDDTINYTHGDGSDSIEGGADNDLFAYTATNAVPMTIIATDSVTINDGLSSLTVNAVETLTFDLDGVSDSVVVNVGNDGNTIDASGLTTTVDLVLETGAGEDIITGGLGADRITGGAGDDQLLGGAGDDTFVFGDMFGSDTIGDFVSDADVIELQGFAFADVSITPDGLGGNIISIDVGPTHHGTIAVNGSVQMTDFLFT